MVLHDVAQRPGLFVVAGAAAHALRFPNRNLHVIDVLLIEIQVVQRGQELAMGQVAGAAKDHQGDRRGGGRGRPERQPLEE